MRLHPPRLLWALALVVALALNSALLPALDLPGPEDGPPWAQPDKLVHLLYYGLLGTLFLRALRPARAAAVLLAIGLTASLGLLDELNQSLRPERSFERADLAADLLGATLATVLYATLPAWRHTLELCLRRSGRAQ